MIAYESVFGVLNAIDDEYDPEVDDDPLPGWRLMELDPQGDLTGRDVGGLHESILGMDPTGREGRPG